MGLRGSLRASLSLPWERSDRFLNHTGRRKRCCPASVGIGYRGGVCVYRHTGSVGATLHHRSSIHRLSPGGQFEGHSQAVL